MGFRNAEFNALLKNLSQVTPAVLDEISDAIEVVQNKVVEFAQRRHDAPRENIKGRKKAVIKPSRGGKNRLKNFDGTPRYGDRLGHLTKSIKAAALKKKRGFVRGRVRAGVGSKVGYATAVEFGGTVPRQGSKRAGSEIIVGFRKPHPFMRPALRAAKRWERLNGTFTRAIQRGLKAAVR